MEISIVLAKGRKSRSFGRRGDLRMTDKYFVSAIFCECKRKRPHVIHMRPLFMSATTYSPTHFRVQYNRPGGA